jgi:hypothetical protein
MRTKTLLLAAVALAFSLAMSQAQVYSQNIVGYVSTPLRAGVLTVISPALDADGTGTNNTVSTVFPTNNVTIGDNVFIFNGTGYDILTYCQPPRGNGLGWYLGNALTNNYPLNPGIAVFYSPAANETNVQTGTVLLGASVSNPNVAAGRISLVASMIPLAGGVTTTLQYSPSIGDVIFLYNNASHSYDSYTYVTPPRGDGTGWYLGNTLTEPQIPVGGGFWLQPATSTNWVQNFTGQ